MSVLRYLNRKRGERKKSVGIEQGTCAGPKGGQGARTPLKNHKNIGFSNNTGPDLLKNRRSQHLLLGHQRHASETPFNGVLLAGR